MGREVCSGGSLPAFESSAAIISAALVTKSEGRLALTNMDYATQYMKADRDLLELTLMENPDPLKILEAEKAVLVCKNRLLSEETAILRDAIRNQGDVLRREAAEATQRAAELAIKVQWLKDACAKTTSERQHFLDIVKLREGERDKARVECFHSREQIAELEDQKRALAFEVQGIRLVLRSERRKAAASRWQASA